MTERWYQARLRIAGQAGQVIAAEILLDESLVDAIRPSIGQPETPCEPLERGRPSFDGMIEEAAAALHVELATCGTTAAAARLVLRHLAKTCDQESLPKRRTVEIFLADQTARGKGRGNSRGK